MTKNNLEIVDIESILLSRELQDAMIQKLTSHFHESRSNRTAILKDYNYKHKEFMSKLEAVMKNIANMYNESKDLGSELEQSILNQKVLNKKLQIAIKEVEKLNEEINIEKQEKEKITLEMVDLQHEQEQKKSAKQKEWNAIKKATLVFKEKLNIHINLDIMDDHDCLTVTFFINQNPDKSNYFVELINYNNAKWKVVKIQPLLKEKELSLLNIDFNRDYVVREMMALLCEIRLHFLKYYLR